jgi:hypothetical protein
MLSIKYPVSYLFLAVLFLLFIFTGIPDHQYSLHLFGCTPDERGYDAQVKFVLSVGKI